jgi:hypothetical protein
MRDGERDVVEAELAEWVLRHPEVWPVARGVRLSDEQVDRLVARIVAGDHAVGRSGPRRWQRGTIAVGAWAVVVLASASLGAAALLRSGQPSVPEAGAACRAEAAVDASAIVVAPGEEPIVACRELWVAGAFEELVGVRGVPDLVACIGGGGAVEVFPGGPSVCGGLGLVAADADLSVGNERIVGLQDRVVEEINAAGCLSVADAALGAEQILSESGLEGWRVVVYSEVGDGVCGGVVVDSETRTLLVRGL